MYKIFKRIFDIIISLIILIISSPILVITSVVLIIINKGSCFFTQDRPGKDEKIIKLYKFKTMNDQKDGKGNYLPDEDRLSKIGRIIRRLSVDELPQLVNVIKGDISLIGPRPLLMEYLPLYNESQKRRHNVKPGITGWAQVNGRNAISWERKFEYDVWYVDNVSFMLDMRILFLTIIKVLKREGINSSTSVTMEKFRGTN